MPRACRAHVRLRSPGDVTPTLSTSCVPLVPELQNAADEEVGASRGPMPDDASAFGAQLLAGRGDTQPTAIVVDVGSRPELVRSRLCPSILSNRDAVRKPPGHTDRNRLTKT